MLVKIKEYLSDFEEIVFEFGLNILEGFFVFLALIDLFVANMKSEDGKGYKKKEENLIQTYFHVIKYIHVIFEK